MPTLVVALASACLEQQEVLPVQNVVADGSIATLEDHGPDLPFAEVAKGTIGAPAVGVAVLLTRCAGEANNDGMPARRTDSALLLTSELPVDIATTVVDLLFVKRPPRHATSPTSVQ